MITINLTLSVQLDAADLAAFDARLAAIARGVALLNQRAETIALAQRVAQLEEELRIRDEVTE